MMSELLEVLAARRGELEKKIARLLEEGGRGVGVKWRPLPELERFPRPEGLVVSAVDGGSNRRSLLSLEVYVVKAYSESARLLPSLALEPLRRRRIIDVDVMLPPRNVGERLTLYRQVAEVKLMLASASSSDLILADGSVESLAARPIHVKLVELDRGGGLVPDCEELASEIERDLASGSPRAMVSKPLIEELASTERAREELAEEIRLVEAAEKAASLKLLLDAVAERGASLVFVTKTGRSNRLFGASVPDQYVLHVSTKSSGYCRVGEPSSLAELLGAGLLPRYCGLRSAAERVIAERGYVRLAPGGPVLGIDLIGPSSSRRPLEEVLPLLSALSPSGYPTLLQLVDRESHIYNEEVDRVVTALGLSTEFTGREVLEP